MAAKFRCHLSYILYFQHFEHPFIGDPKPYIVPRKRHSIDSFRVIVILRTRVEFKQLAESNEILIAEQSPQIFGETHFYLLPALLINKTTAHTGVCIGILYVRLNIIDWSAVYKVGTCNNKRTIFNTQQAHRRKPQRVRAERRARGKHTHVLIAAKQRRTHKRRPLALPFSIERKLPYEPQIVEPLNATQSIGICIFRFKNNAPNKLRHKSALARHAELCGKL